MVSPTTQREVRTDTAEWDRFMPSEGLPVRASGQLVFKATPKKLYELLRRFTVADAVVLLATGNERRALKGEIPATRRDASLAVELSTRSIDVQAFLDVYSSDGSWQVLDTAEGIASEEGQRALDAAEYASLTSARRVQRETSQRGEDGPPVWFRPEVRSGAIRLADIDAMGDKEVHGLPHIYGPILRDLAAGRGKLSAAEIGQIIAGTNALSRSGRDTYIGTVVRVAHRHGEEALKIVKRIDSVRAVLDTAEADPDDSRALSLISYASEVGSPPSFSIGGEAEWMEVDLSRIWVYRAAAVIELWKAGISAENAKRMLADEMPAAQIIAVLTEGVARSLADGWL